MDKPKIFVSSTVLDFEDLRSALKYYLEELGYDIQMSEYPNFNVDPKCSKFDACIKNLEKCQYFILLIGYRRGNWYDKDKLSITNKEYRTAKELIEKGHKLKIIAFVRKSIWILKNDRQSLLKHFSEKSVQFSNEIDKTGTCIIDDPLYIFNFLSEISEGIKYGGSDSPANNWIYDFESFEDIIIALKTTFGLSDSLEIKRVKKLFLIELEQNRNKFLVPKYSKNPNEYKDASHIPTENLFEIIGNLYCRYVIDKNGKLLIGKIDIQIPGSEISNLFLYAFIFPVQLGIKNIKIKFLDRVITEGIYLSYNIYQNNYDTNLLTFALDKLYDWLNGLIGFFDTEVYKNFSNDMAVITHDGSAHRPYATISMHTAGTIIMFSSFARIENLINAILELLNNGNANSLISFDFSDNYLQKYTKNT